MIDVFVVGGIYRERDSISGTSRLGGSGLYAAVAAASLGASTALAASVGADDADEAFAILDNAGVDRSAVDTVRGASGEFVMEDTGEVHVPRVEFKNGTSPPALLLDPPRARLAVVFGMPDFDPFAAGLIARWVEPENTLIWDRQGWLSQTRDAAPASGIPAQSRVYLANLAEASDEVGGATATQLLANHPLPGFDSALIKNGRWGTTLIGQDGRAAIPAFRVPIASTIGSGDVFAGALAAGLSQGKTTRAAATNAAAAAAVAITAPAPFLSGADRGRIDTIVETSGRHYVDPTFLESVAVLVEAMPTRGLEVTLDRVRTLVRNLGLADTVTTSTVVKIRVLLRSDDSRLFATVSDGAGSFESTDIELSHDLDGLMNQIADIVEVASA